MGALRVDYAETVVRGESLELLPHRAIFWRRTSTLFIADTHFGKPTTISKASGIVVPEATITDDLARLDEALSVTSARRLVVLGDFLHARAGRSASTLECLEAWRTRHAGLRMLMVRGNHDLHAGDPPGHWEIDCQDEPVAEPPFLLRHMPGPEEGGAFWLAGHMHPGYRLQGSGREAFTLPAFIFSQHGCVLPAFSGFTGLSRFAPAQGDSVFVVVNQSVFRVV